MNFVTKNLVAPFGVPAAYMHHAERFADMVSKLGVEACGAQCLSHGRKGFEVSLCSGEHEFRLVIERDRVKLGMIRLEDQQLVPLGEGSPASQATFEQFTRTIRQMEDR